MEAGLTTDTAAYAVYHAGTEAQKHEWLPQFASGEVISESASRNRTAVAIRAA